MLNPKEKEFKVGDTVMIGPMAALGFSLEEMHLVNKECIIENILYEGDIEEVRYGRRRGHASLYYIENRNRVYLRKRIPLWLLDRVKVYEEKPRIKVGDLVVPRIHETSNLFGRITKFNPVQVRSVKEDTSSGVIKVELSSGGWVDANYLDVVKTGNQTSMSNIGKNISTGQKETTAPMLDLKKFYQVAASVKPRSKEQVALHLAAESGEIAECLIQPERNGNLVEESIDAILCALDLVYLELGKTHGEKEITEILNKTIADKLDKWYRTCKSS